MSPSQLLALKSLDPPHDEKEHGEHQDGQPDISQVLHDASFRRAEYRLSKQRSERSIPPANDVHAVRRQSLTKFMRKLGAHVTTTPCRNAPGPYVGGTLRPPEAAGTAARLRPAGPVTASQPGDGRRPAERAGRACIGT